MIYDEFVALRYAPMIRHFSLELANGYKDIGFSVDRGIKILVAENGAGKTTLMNALYYIINGNHQDFIRLDFDKLKLSVGNKTWTKSRSEFSAFSNEIYHKMISNYNFRSFTPPRPTKQELEEIWNVFFERGDEASLTSTRYFLRQDVSRRFPISMIKSMLEDMGSGMPGTSVEHKRRAFIKFSMEVSQELKGVEVLYLPTYRRIEAYLPQFSSRGTPSKTRHSYNSSWDADQLIHFGMQDVEAKLSEMAEEIRLATVQEFSFINARTLDDLMFGRYKLNVKESAPIDLNSLQVVLGRLGRDNVSTRERLEELIKSGEINNEDNIYLKSFLGQLMQAYASTQEKEASIESFIEAVNSYWDDDADKKFVFDKASAEARVTNSYTNRELPLEALSSGEKQIVSIFARLYLQPERKFVILIDEPELSLSMEWQEKFLPDLARAPSCLQIIAITHSPFIFKNELRRFAGSVDFARRKM